MDMGSAGDAFPTADQPFADPTGRLVADAHAIHAASPDPADLRAAMAWPGTDVPTVAMDAYRAAAALADQRVSSCGIQWYDLAGIAQVESNQGRHGATTIAASGETAPPILGPPLDGQAHRADIPAIATSYDDGGGPHQQAVGPLQFLPATWNALGASVRVAPGDPNNLWDAAVGAALYLCRAGSFATGPNVAALYSYNRSASYVTEVAALEQAFAAVAVAGPPPPLPARLAVAAG